MLRRRFASANIELLCVWVTFYEGALDLLATQKDLLVFITSIFYSLNNLPNELSKTPARRIVMGMIKIIEFSFAIPEIQCTNSYFFTWIFRFVMR